MKIPITCRVTEYETLLRLKKFQGALKTLPKSEMEKLKKSILKYGFSFPVFVWEKNILDGHQRLDAIMELIKDGHEIDAIPIVRIDAANEKEAAEKLLLINSRYAQINQPGFENFIQTYDIEIEKIQPFLAIPEVVFEFEEDKVFVSDLEKLSFDYDQIGIQVEKYDHFLIDEKHHLICCGVSSDWDHWINLIEEQADLFFPYASIFIFEGVKAANYRLIVVQPDPYVVAVMLKIHTELNGSESVKKL